MLYKDCTLTLMVRFLSSCEDELKCLVYIIVSNDNGLVRCLEEQ